MRRPKVNDTVTFLPKSTPFPKVTLSDFQKQACEDIKHLLKHPNNTIIPSLEAGYPT